MQKEPLISIIIPCYMQGEFLTETIQSVIKQTYKNWECIIINDGSTDNTETIVAKFLDTDSRLKYIYQEHKGVSRARNIGIENSNGKFIQFLDSDDIISEQKIERQVKALSVLGENSLSISSFNFLENQKLIPHRQKIFFTSQNYLNEIIKDWETELSIPIHCFLFNSSFFKEKKIRFNEVLKNNEDWDCWIEIFSLYPKVVFIDEQLAIYRLHDFNATRDRQKIKQGFLNAIKLNFEKFSKNSKEYYLLQKKYNLVKYGVNSRYTILSLLVSPFLILFNFTIRVLRFLKRKLKELL